MDVKSDLTHWTPGCCLRRLLFLNSTGIDFLSLFVSDRQNVASSCRHCAVLSSLWLGSIPGGATDSPHSSAGAVWPGLSAPDLLPTLLLQRESSSFVSGFCVAQKPVCVSVLVFMCCLAPVHEKVISNLVVLACTQTPAWLVIIKKQTHAVKPKHAAMLPACGMIIAGIPLSHAFGFMLPL
jgi:hypothetical protein